MLVFILTLLVVFIAVFIPVFIVIRQGRINAINNNKSRALAKSEFDIVKCTETYDTEP